MLRVVVGLYYSKHMIYTRDQDDHGEYRELKSVNLLVCMLIIYVVMFKYGDGTSWNKRFMIWIFFGHGLRTN